MTRTNPTHRVTFTGAEGNKLVGDAIGHHGRAVLLLHGGGQTRHAWRNTGDAIARAGMTAYAVDQRGHGDSEWVASGKYTFADFAADARELADQLAARTGSRPVVAGASLGGIAALTAEGIAAKQARQPLFAGLVLVDITPRVDAAGVAKVQGFMREHARDGFASVDEAAQAVAAYLPHRPRPASNEGLKKNLRLHPDGRWRWHWDPRFLESRGPDSVNRTDREEALVAGAKSLKNPVLLVRGGSSELVHDEHVREFLALVPHATYADVAGARHMVAGDRNDQFSEAILKFLTELKN
ncbi:MAG TPA: alpha/beta hydrolase [Xanthobacteraceae bacterium]|nr:alpha/beta hydrolase [Xanthobacteraceae bacterium]